MSKAIDTDTVETDQHPGVPDSDPVAREPFEPAVPDPDAAASRDTLLALTSFLAHGGGDWEPVPGDAWPAAMHRFRDLARHRLPYPLVLHGNGRCQPLGERVDALADARVDADDLEGDAAEHLRHDLRRAETGLRRARAGGDALAACWRQAAESLVQSADPDRRERLSANLERAAAAIGSDERLMALDPATPSSLVPHLMRGWWRSRHVGWRAELDGLVERLQALLRSEADRSGEGRSPDRLAHSVGTADAGDLDFDALSKILDRSHLDQPLPEHRQARIETLLASLDHARTRYCPAEGPIDDDQGPAFIDGDCRAAMERALFDLDATAAMVRDVEVARLELENRYLPERLDDYFDGFDARHLDRSQRDLCPPALVVLDREQAEAGMAGLLEALSGDLPVKFVLGLDLAALDPADWPARLGSMAVGLNHPFVFQGTLSDPGLLADNLERALDHAGPALLVVHVPDETTAIPAYLQAAAAVESRLLPAFRFDPLGGHELAAQAELLANPDPEADWSREAFTYTDPEGETREVDLAFTAADLMAVTPRYRDHFWCLPPSHWHPAMEALDAFLQADQDDRAGRIPYLSLVAASGELLRAVPDGRVIAAVTARRRDWRLLQETCGVGNSHASRALERERDRLNAERDEAIEAARQEYRRQLDQDLGELSRRIVTNIADRLMATDPAMPPAGAPGSTPRATAPVAEQAPPDVAEDDASAESEDAAGDDPGEAEVQFVLDDPYIDTPLCTTCDDCTTLNPGLFGYDENKQAYIKDPAAGTFRELVLAAEKCPVGIIHPGKPGNPDEPDLEQWVERAKPFQ